MQHGVIAEFPLSGDWLAPRVGQRCGGMFGQIKRGDFILPGKVTTEPFPNDFGGPKNGRAAVNEFNGCSERLAFTSFHCPPSHSARLP